MKVAKIIKEISLLATLREMPIGEEQIIPSRYWDSMNVRRRASELKRENLEFRVRSNKMVKDTFVTRLK